MQRFLRQVIPFLFIGIALVVFSFGIMLLAYLFLMGAAVGAVFYMIKWVRHHFFAKKTVIAKKSAKKGRIIDVDDWKKL